MAPSFAGIDTKTIVRAIEGWVVVFASAFFSEITVGGQPVDLFTHHGQVAAASGIIGAILLALRRVSATP